MKIRISKGRTLTTILVICVFIVFAYLIPRMTAEQKQLTGVIIIVTAIASVSIYEGVRTHLERKRNKHKSTAKPQTQKSAQATHVLEPCNSKLSLYRIHPSFTLLGLDLGNVFWFFKQTWIEKKKCAVTISKRARKCHLLICWNNDIPGKTKRRNGIEMLNVALEKLTAPESFLSLSTFHKALNCARVRER